MSRMGGKRIAHVRCRTYATPMLDSIFGVLFGMLPPKIMGAIVVVMLLVIGGLVLWATT